MNNQEKKAVLGRYREAERLEREILRWKTGAERTVEAASWMQEGCASRRALEETAAAMQEIALALADRRRESCRLRADLEARIDAVGDPRLRELLRRRYIDGCTWEMISEAMGMSYQWVCKLHGEALNAVPIDRS